ncbi:MAG: aminopeptidase N [Alphaproteobacteria bacterium]|jgi:aminopeptidase N|nr:aminopeptidase N [Alphaproteobacteria bacterium]
MSEPVVKYLKDYQKPDFLITKTKLDFTILADKIVVKSDLTIKKNSEATDMHLNGEELTTKSVSLNGNVLKDNQDYKIDSNVLTIFNVPNEFTLQTEVEFNPYTNTKLMGIYKSNSCMASQCEPEGFRRITWFIDRPDVMSVWEVSISAKKDMFETLLSNGNLISDTTTGDIRTCVFDDPFPKPSYLFAFVAGNFDICSKPFKTMSGRDVKLSVYVEKGKKNQAQFALDSLALSMKWDEDTFGLEYELDVFSIVAVSDFNFGAMENKSLNIFNEAYVLADPYIATDDDFFNIESIVAHEYFHNFTGDRITCRDWFQLTLKEGLTVFRDHLFSESIRHRDIARINDVEVLRNVQFQEDKGPLAHPIRPQSYIEMNNFYTTTVYDKGSEVIRMIETLIGVDNFKKGITTYFELFDGQAVACEDFVYAMEKASGVSLEKFKQWYQQSGTPIVSVKTNYDSTTKTFSISLTQINNPTFDQKEKKDLVLPLRLALFNKGGEQLELNNSGKEYVAVLDRATKEFTFNNIAEEPVLSINRYFSAPIILDFNQTDEHLINLMNNDTDGFNKYEAGQKYFRKHMLNMVNRLEARENIPESEVKQLISPLADILKNYQKDMYMTSMMLKLPSLASLEMNYTSNLPIDSMLKTIKLMEEAIANVYEKDLLNIFKSIKDNESEFSTLMMGYRSLKNRTLFYLLKTKKDEYLKMSADYFKTTKSMTKKIGVLAAVKDFLNTTEHTEIFSSFYKEFENYPTVLNKWFLISASINHGNAIENVKRLATLETFSYTNPNKVRHLVGGFTSNTAAFHNIDGSGYKFLEEMIIKMDEINPSISANLAKNFSKLNIHNKTRQELMRKSINNILSQKDISKGLYEILSKSIAN